MKRFLPAPLLVAASLCLATLATGSAPEDSVGSVAKEDSPPTAANTNSAESVAASPEPAPDSAPAVPVADPLQRHKLVYFVEHQLLPDMWLRHGKDVDAKLREQGGPFISGAFEYFAGQSSTFWDSADVSAAEPIDLGNGYTGWLITFPEPKMTPESRYSLLLSKGEELRFFAWEFDNLMGKTSWYNCEWTQDHTHLNYGAVEDGSKESFINLVKAVLDKKSEPEAATDLSGVK